MKPWREGVCPSLVSQDGTVTGQCFQGTGLTQNVIRTAFTQRNTHTILNTHAREHTRTHTKNISVGSIYQSLARLHGRTRQTGMGTCMLPIIRYNYVKIYS